jgi:hypothetical protein
MTIDPKQPAFGPALSPVETVAVTLLGVTALVSGKLPGTVICMATITKISRRSTPASRGARRCRKRRHGRPSVERHAAAIGRFRSSQRCRPEQCVANHKIQVWVRQQSSANACKVHREKLQELAGATHSVPGVTDRDFLSPTGCCERRANANQFRPIRAYWTAILALRVALQVSPSRLRYLRLSSWRSRCRRHRLTNRLSYAWRFPGQRANRGPLD